MARRSKISSGAPEPDMTPMIDIVFQLISFFMVVNNFEQTQADERVKLPRDQLAKPPIGKAEHELVLNIGFVRNLQGELEDPLPWMFNVGGEDMVRPLQTLKMLQQEARVYQNRKVDLKDVTVKIRADYEVPSGIPLEVMQLSQKAGFEKFAFPAFSGPES